MNSKHIITILLISFSLLFGCHTTRTQVEAPAPISQIETPAPNYPTELKWVRQSVEYEAICIEVYRMAWQAVKKQTANLNEDWVVILDVDETALDNSRYQEILYEKNERYPFYWDGWVLEENCPPVPGVKAFIDSVRSLGKYAHVAYITNRKAKNEAATRNNLKKVDLWQDGDILLCQNNTTERRDTKTIRREEVQTGTGRCDGLGEKQIIALIGDQLGDFTSYPTDVPIEKYREYFQKLPEWGVKYFMLPNPMYGAWLRNYPHH